MKANNKRTAGRLPTAASCLILLACLGVSPLLADDKETLRFDVEQVTSGPKHHLFGYIGQCLTIPWSADGRYILSLEVGFHDRMPQRDDAAKVVLVDTRNKNKIVPVDETRAWNFQQGTMFYWHPRSAKTQFFFNDRDPSNGHVFTVLYDLHQRRRVREYRFADTPIGNGGVSPTGHAFLGLNYGRLARLRRVTGYPAALDWSEDHAAPSDDGIFIVDVESGKKRVLVSYQQLARLLDKHGNGSKGTPLFINHTLFSRDGQRVYFFVRGGWSGNRGERINVPCSIKSDGTDLVLHQRHIGGHPEWGEGTKLIGRDGPDQIFYDVEQKRVTGRLGTPDVIPDPEGDISLSPSGRWFVNGSSKGGKNRYVVLRLSDGHYGRTASFSRGDYRSGDLRIDSAPRWNRTNDAILVPGITAEGTRQLFVIRVRAEG
ncbi:MAG: hypothetical protein HQ567_13260 [Candidatus Nealsonbacteria bacterium]|nr:hypothetical protein [Candidatus Nealsonbacteria bacterium]